MGDLETTPGAQKCVVGIYFTCVLCGTVEEILVP